ncbi:non-ribosomal peptide synthetase, partial [Herbaspirillum rhizosphaerae]|uniref:non-ribosomal peptide synthetase n=1 Tax=Herbaspirillum rhizosphaerae TaxID=346179 RepID=UPI000B09530F
ASLSALRQITVGGEGLPGDALRQWRAGPLQHIRLDNLYGPTETTVACMYRQTCAADTEQAIVSIGQAYPSRSVYVMDAEGNEAPDGGLGELCIAGDTLARGYLGRAALTAEKFIPDPYRDDGARLYRSGDLCRRREDGSIAFLGRIDQQVKLRGFRIELGEIEAVLRQSPGVQDAVVELCGEGEGKRLVGYVVGEAAHDDIRLLAQARLPGYMVPSALVTLERLPLMPNGKVDRKALPAPQQEPAARQLVGPDNQTQAILLAIWRDVLGREDIGVTDNFFEAGGDSILSLRIISRAAQAGLKLTPRQVFENPDIARLAALATRQATAYKPEVLTPLPLTPIQHAFFERYPQGQSHWNQSLLLKIDGALEASALAGALAHLVQTFDALRLRFIRTEAGWRQQVQPFDNAAMQVLTPGIDLRGRADWRTQLEQQGAALQRSLDIEHGPLIRAGYFVLDGEARLLLTIHHLAVDGVSWRILLDTLQDAYQRLLQGEPAPTAAGTPWSVWAAESAETADSEAMQGELSWWQAHLSGAAATSPSQNPANSATPHRRRVQFDAAITEQLLNQPARAYGAGLDELLLAALGRSIAAQTGEDKVLVSMEGHGREPIDSALDLSNSVGWFTARFPLCLDIPQDAAASLISTKESLRNVPHKGVRWGWLRTYGDAAARAALAALPTPAISFNYLGQFDQSLQRNGIFHFAGEPFGAAMADDGISAYALDFSAVVADCRLTVDWRLLPESWSASSSDRLVQDFESQVHALLQHCQAAAPQKTASDFPLAGLSQHSLQELLSRHLTQLPAAEIDDIYPATPLQSGLLYHSLTQAGQGLYLIQKRLSLSGALNLQAMRDAWQLAVTRHPILRTRFIWQHGSAPLQVVAKDCTLPFDHHDWHGLGASGYEQRLQSWLAQDLAAGFDPGLAPLLRINVFARADGHCDLVWTGHHLLTDGWSSAQLLGEVMQAYRLLSAGQPVASATPAPYRDYVAWLRKQPDAGAWWRSRLAEVRDPAGLGSCLAVAAGNASTGAEQASMSLTPELSERLAQSARRHRVTVNTLIQAAWALLLARFGNRDQVVFGVTVSGRPHDLPGMERMLGLFINSLPIWVDVPPAARLSAWFAQIQQRNSALRQYEHTDLGQIQQWAGQSGESLFDSLLVFENYPVDEEMRKDATGLTLEGYAAVERSHYPLVLTVGPGASLTLNWKWDRARLDKETIADWAASYIAVLEQFAGAVDLHIGDIAVDSASAREQVLAWSRPAMSAPRSELLHVLIERQAARQPDAVAVVGEGGQALSYAELNAAANRLAWRLIDMGVAPEVKVGLAFTRSADMLVAMLAVLKAGGAYVPLDPEYPQERLGYMIGDSAIGLILSESGVRTRLPVLDTDTVMVLELDLLGEPDERTHNPQVPQHDAALAYVIYTSGSTGRPKGAQLTHRNVARLLSGTEQHFAFSSSDVWTLFHSYAFDFSVWEIFGALCHGGKLVVVPFAVSRAPLDFLALLRRHGVTVLNQTPSAFRQLLDVPELYRADDLALRLVIFGGEALEPRTLRPWLEHFGDERIQLVNMYGITETTVHVTYRRVLQADLDSRASPVGVQIADLGLYVLDVHGGLAATDVAGELFVAGEGLARGYLHRAALTAERFVPDPFSSQGGRLYRTGDLARRRRDGQLEYLGRIDQQVKIRGFRIETGEIETQLLALPQVREACVLTDQGPSGTRLIAYVTVVAGTSPDTQQLRAQLATRLPDYMLPAALIVLARLPLTPNGKIDKRALPAPEFNAAAYVAPQGETEQQLALVWQEVLAVEQVGRKDNFFALGGDSILSLQVVARAHKRGVEISPRQLFETPTVAGLAQALEQARQRVQPQRIYSLSAGQGQAGKSAVAHCLMLRWRQPPERAILQDAVNRLVSGHDALRAQLVSEDGQWRQTVAAQLAVPLDYLDLRDAADPARALEQQRLELIALAPAEGVLLRFCQLDLPQETVLMAALHPLVADAVSLALIANELARRCGGLEEHGAAVTGLPDRWRNWIADQPPADLAKTPLPAMTLQQEFRQELVLAPAPWSAALSAHRLQPQELLLAALSLSLPAAAATAIQVNNALRAPMLATSIGQFHDVREVWAVTGRDPAVQIASAKRALRNAGERNADAGAAPARLGLQLQLRPPTAPQEQQPTIDVIAAPVSLTPGHDCDLLCELENGQLWIRLLADPQALPASRAQGMLAAFTDAIGELVAYCLEQPAAADASDFALAKLNQQELMRLPLALADVQDIYPATPLQNGMLFHSLLQNGQGVYIDQNCFTLTGALDLAALHKAWSVAVQRHDILRTHFRWEHGGDALQVVQRHAELALTVHDWSDRSAAAYAAGLSAWRAEDLAAGFALDCAPLLRINVFVRPDGRHDCVSTNHHVLLDGWSYAQLVGEVMHVYQATVNGQSFQLGAPGAYRDYLAWMAAQASPRDWWMARYATVDAPAGVGTSVLSASASSLYASDRLKHIVHELDLDATAALEAAAKRHQVTVNTLVQGAWAILLGRYGNRDQAAFGVTVSGRPGDMPEVEKVLGLFINSLPLWVNLPAGDGIGSWLSALQGANYALREHGYASVSQVQQWTGLSGEALFDSLVVFENYPIDRALRDGLHDLSIEGFQITERTHYPMVLVAVPAKHFRFRFKFDGARIGTALAQQLSAHFLELLEQLVHAEPQLPLGSLQLSPERKPENARADYPFIPVAQRISAR